MFYYILDVFRLGSLEIMMGETMPRLWQTDILVALVAVAVKAIILSLPIILLISPISENAFRKEFPLNKIKRKLHNLPQTIFKNLLHALL